MYLKSELPQTDPDAAFIRRWGWWAGVLGWAEEVVGFVWKLPLALLWSGLGPDGATSFNCTSTTLIGG